MILEKYKIKADKITAIVKIVDGEDFTKLYKISIPGVSKATSAVLNNIRNRLLGESEVNVGKIFEPDVIEDLKEKFSEKAERLLEEKIPNLDEKTKNILTGTLIQDMLGLGRLELLISDENLEEIAVNSAKEPVWVFHKKYGWVKTNVTIKDEDTVKNYSSIIARRVGRQITTLNPLLDAYLVTGDRANATLFPISSKGNTITIRKFARKVWTVTDFIKNKTLNSDVAAFLWELVHYEMNLIVAGGTSSGKTSLLNSLMPFIPPNHRVVSIEDTRELQLPDFLHWVPLTVRTANPEGKGEVSMLDLMINSLRMRPDRIVVGEIRRGDQAEVLFEAMHTGHSVYSTLHAETVEQVIRRMTNPPIDIPEVMLEALQSVIVQYRNRRKGIRRTYQLAELTKAPMRINTLFKLTPEDEIEPYSESKRVFDELKMHTGMSEKKIRKDIENKKKILNWMVKKDVNQALDVGKIMAKYYSDPKKIIDAAIKNKSPKKLL